jgi:hypothetical protein
VSLPAQPHSPIVFLSYSKSLLHPFTQLRPPDAAKFGHTYLAKHGWTPSTGLGVAGDGRVSHIAVAQKLDQLGIGAGRPDGPDAIAWKQAQEFEGLLERLNAAGGEAEDMIEAEEEREEVGGDETEDKARRKERRREEKRKAKEAKAALEASGSSTPSTPEEPVVAAPAPRRLAYVNQHLLLSSVNL